MSHAYSFAIDEGGQVTEVFEILEDGTEAREDIHDDETYRLIDGFVVLTESGDDPEWEVYAQDPSTELWYEAADGEGEFDLAVLGTLDDWTPPSADDHSDDSDDRADDDDDDDSDDDDDDDDSDDRDDDDDDDDDDGDDDDLSDDDDDDDTDDDDDDDAPEAYVFDFDDTGAVTAKYEVGEDGELDDEDLDGETYTRIDGFVVATQGGVNPEWEVYAQDPETGYWYEVAEDDGEFDPAILAELEGIALPPANDDNDDDDDDDGEDLDGYIFQFDEEGNVVAWFELDDDGTAEQEDLDDTDFSVIDGRIVDTASDGPMPQWRVYVPNEDGDVWYKVEEGYGTFVPARLQDLPATLPDQAAENYVGARSITYYWGDDGDDDLAGTDGDDHFGGGAGNDTASGGAGNDLMGGGTGNDSVSGDDGDDVIGAGAGDDHADGGAGNDIVNGGAGDDSLSGADGDDTMGGSYGTDEIDGGEGDDDMGGGFGTDDMAGGAGRDRIGGGAGNDTVDGGTGDDFLAGGGRDDELFGRAGDDTLNGGQGDDTMTGGEGDDTFVFRVLQEGESDTITDFEDGSDLLVLRGVDGDDGRFDALSISDTEAGAEIVAEGHTITLEGVAAADLGLDDFIFV